METKQLTKKQVNDELKPIYDIYAMKIDGRYYGLRKDDCKTDIQLIFWNIVTTDEFSYKNKKDQFNEVYKRLGLPVGEHKEFEKTLNGVVIRNLPANESYTFMESGSFAEGEGWCCENCGRFIRHWNEVKNTKGRIFMVGSECINTVVKYDINEHWETMQKISEGNRRKSTRTKLNKILKDGGKIEMEEGSYSVYGANGNFRGSISVSDYDLMYRKGIKK